MLGGRERKRDREKRGNHVVSLCVCVIARHRKKERKIDRVVDGENEREIVK